MTKNDNDNDNDNDNPERKEEPDGIDGGSCHATGDRTDAAEHNRKQLIRRKKSPSKRIKKHANNTLAREEGDTTNRGYSRHITMTGDIIDSSPRSKKPNKNKPTPELTNGEDGNGGKSDRKQNHLKMASKKNKTKGPALLGTPSIAIAIANGATASSVDPSIAKRKEPKRKKKKSKKPKQDVLLISSTTTGDAGQTKSLHSRSIPLSKIEELLNTNTSYSHSRSLGSHSGTQTAHSRLLPVSPEEEFSVLERNDGNEQVTSRQRTTRSLAAATDELPIATRETVPLSADPSIAQEKEPETKKGKTKKLRRAFLQLSNRRNHSRQAKSEHSRSIPISTKEEPPGATNTAHSRTALGSRSGTKTAHSRLRTVSPEDEFPVLERKNEKEPATARRQLAMRSFTTATDELPTEAGETFPLSVDPSIAQEKEPETKKEKTKKPRRGVLLLPNRRNHSRQTRSEHSRSISLGLPSGSKTAHARCLL